MSTLSTLGKRYGARAATLLLHYRYIIATLAHRKSPAEPRVGSFGRRPGADFRVRRDSRIARIARYKGHIVRVSLYRAIRGGQIIIGTFLFLSSYRAIQRNTYNMTLVSRDARDTRVILYGQRHQQSPLTRRCVSGLC